MTRMIPEMISQQCTSSERRVFRWLRDAPNTDGWVCLHSLGIADIARKRAGEVDFLLMTPQGVFVLEVKGGAIRVENGLWHYQGYTKHESPFDQARKALFAITKRLAERFGDRSDIPRLRYGYGLLLTDVAQFDSLGVDGDPRIVFTRSDFGNPPGTFVRRLADFAVEVMYDGASRISPTTDHIDELIHFLRGDREYVPELSHIAEDIAREQLLLTQQQYRALERVTTYPRALVEGGAGTGKTLLAVELARRRATTGAVLLLVFNRLLAARLTAELADERGVRVASLHSFLRSQIEASDLAAEFRSRSEGVAGEKLFWSLFPEYAHLAALELEDAPFDSLVVDEGQDLLTRPVFDALMAFVKGGRDRGKWCLFLDPNKQAGVYGHLDRDLLEEIRNLGVRNPELTVNCRNTRQIVNLTRTVTRPDSVPACFTSGPGVRVAFYPDAKGQTVQLNVALAQLIDGGAKPRSITVLSMRRAEDAAFGQPLQMEVTLLDDSNVHLLDSRKGTITASPISGFKGLENDFVVLTDIEDIVGEWERSVLYVGMTRARVGLYLLINESQRAEYEKLARAHFQELAEAT